MSEINYTITSGDPDDYGTIRESLIAPQTQNTEFMITQLTTMCSFLILNKDDYIELVIYRERFEHDEKIIYTDSYLYSEKVRIYWTLVSSKLNFETFSQYLNLSIGDSITYILSDIGNPIFKMDYRFAFSDMSNRMKIVLGMSDVKFDKTEYYYIPNITPRSGINLTIEDYLIIQFENLETPFKHLAAINKPMTYNEYLEVMKTIFKDTDTDSYPVEYFCVENAINKMMTVGEFSKMMTKIFGKSGFQFPVGYYSTGYRPLMRHSKPFRIIGGSINMRNQFNLWLSHGDDPNDGKFVEPFLNYDYSTVATRVYTAIGLSEREPGRINVINLDEYIKIRFYDEYRDYTDFQFRPIKDYDISDVSGMMVLTMLKEMIPKMEIFINADKKLSFMYRK